MRSSREGCSRLAVRGDLIGFASYLAALPNDFDWLLYTGALYFRTTFRPAEGASQFRRRTVRLRSAAGAIAQAEVSYLGLRVSEIIHIRGEPRVAAGWAIELDPRGAITIAYRP